MEFEIKEISNKEKKRKHLNIIKIIVILLLICSILGLIIEYCINENIREYIDYNILNKDVTEKSTTEISIEGSNNFIYSHDNVIEILKNNVLQAYNSSAKKEYELNITITNPIFKSCGKYMAIAEKNGKKIYMLSGKNIIWQNDFDGEISNISINKNGFLSIILSQTTYKSVIITINPQGNEIFRYYLSNTYAIDSDISNNNKYLAIAEINTNGTQIQSSIRILSMEKVKNDADNSVIYQKNANYNQMLVGIKYNDSNNLLAMYDDEIRIINTNFEDSLQIKYDVDTLFANIELNKSVTELKQISRELETNSEIDILNTVTNRKSKFKINSIPKELLGNKNIIAVNTGMEAYFLKDNGFLIKKYESNQEIKEIILGENIAGIVYKNKINIIKL